jgi:ferredoxin
MAMSGGSPSARVDERDTMFARAARRPGTTAYDDYYSRRPELRRVDDRLRALPELCEPGGRCFDATVCGEATAHFRAIDTIAVDPVLVDRWGPEVRAAADPGATVKRLAVAMGAIAAGVTRLEPEHIYTHKGRFDDDYGREIRLDHPSVLVFLVEMDFEAMRQAPHAAVIRESARQYYRAAVIARTIERVLLTAGVSAKAHFDAHYDVMLVPLAVAAGLGELGRHNLLVADRCGTRVRIGAVTLGVGVAGDAPVSLGVRRFCESCRKCSDNCPPRALSNGSRELVRGVWKWPTNVERCYAYWRGVGTDCGICMAVCPFSHPDTWWHNAVRAVIRRAPWLARPARLADDLLYGRRFGQARTDQTLT